MQDFLFLVLMAIFLAILAIPGAWYAHLVWHMIMIGWGS